MTGHHDTKPGEKTRQSDKRLEEHESVLDSPEHIDGVEKTATRQSQEEERRGLRECLERVRVHRTREADEAERRQG